jgi:D-alanyl-D-alanine carboxypeptidase/D-alanyl-D-alanine-endopeptidase (penicillin-binding protein 4)
MPQYLFILLAAGVFLANPARADLKERLMAQIKSSALGEKDFGAVVAAVTPSAITPVFDYQGEKSFIPASVTKVFTAGAALKILGPTRRFTTELLSSAPVQGKTLKGDIYLKGGGDPSFVTETMWVLVNEFARWDISKIEGSIVVDDTLFDDVRFDPSREDSRVDRAYDAPVGAMSFNWNSVNVFIRPGASVGVAADVHADPENEMVSVENKVKTVAANKRTQLAVQRRSLGQGREKVIVTGQIALGAEEKVYYKNVTHPSLWSGANLKASLRLRGIEVTGEVKRGKAPEGARKLADVDSKSLNQIVQDMLKFSNNFVAEMLAKHLAIAKGAAQGTMAGGMKVLKDYALSSGVESKGFVLVNPSGLTRDNIFRPMDMVHVLAFIQNDFLIGPEAMSGFPLIGLDGTLKSRLKEYPGRVRAKTGMLTGVASLAGWVENKKGPFAFAFFYNGKAGLTGSARDLFNNLLKTLIESE